MKNWYRIANGNISGYLELTEEEANLYRRDGYSVVQGLPPYEIGLRVGGFDE